MTKHIPKPEFIRVYHTEGKTLAETAAIFDMSITTAMRWMATYEIPRRPRGGRGRPETKAARNQEIRSLIKSGRSLSEIGTAYGISRQRVWDIVKSSAVP